MHIPCRPFAVDKPWDTTQLVKVLLGRFSACMAMERTTRFACSHDRCRTALPWGLPVRLDQTRGLFSMWATALICSPESKTMPLGATGYTGKCSSLRPGGHCVARRDLRVTE